MRATSLAQVAARSGVSLTTASRVLNPDNRHPVSDAVRRRVLAAAADLHYSGNALARGLKTQRTQTVGLIAHDLGNAYFNEFARGVADTADDAGYLTVMCNTNHDEETELRYLQLLQDHRVAGVVFIAGGFEGRRYREAVNRRVEAIRSYGGQLVALGPRADRLPAEVPDNRGGARIGTEHLLGLGHTRIAFIAGTHGLRTATERLAGYREALTAAGVPFDEGLVVSGSFSEAGGAQAMRELFASGADFTAVFASNDAMALGCLQEFARRGLRAPGDISLLGMDGIPIGRTLNPPLTTVAVPMRAIGAAGMRRLLELLESGGAGPARGRRTNVHPTELIVRKSTAPPAPGEQA